MEIAGWSTSVRGHYFIDEAPITLVGTKEKWACISRCSFVEMSSGLCCQKAAKTRMRLRGGVLFQDDDRLTCKDHQPIIFQQFEERVRYLDDHYEWLKRWAEQNPLKPEDLESISKGYQSYEDPRCEQCDQNIRNNDSKFCKQCLDDDEKGITEDKHGL
jgi:hypothetical protein